jgi:hypothetical protein
MYTWTQHSTNAKYIVLNGRADALVRTTPLPAGYLWQFAKRCGHAASVEEAKAMVEALSDHYSIPPSQRWMTL